MATRFEVRAPNPHTNSYLAIAAMYLAMLNGIHHALESGRTTNELGAECSKQPGETATYLMAERAYRSEDDVFEHFTQEQRDRLFGRAPATVPETLARLGDYPDRDALLCAGEVFTPAIIESYTAAMLGKWRLELSQRIIPANIETVREIRRLHSEDTNHLDEQRWREIQSLRLALMKDSIEERSLFTRIREAIARGDDGGTSSLQLEMNARMTELQDRYTTYARNLLDLSPADAGAGVGNGHRLAATAIGASP
jgi:glutamine synthetase